VSLTVQQALALPVLGDADLLAGAAAAPDREVRWTTVIEWRGADFVRPGEFVLTTGLGCDAARFEEFARRVIDADAAALCVTLHEAGELTEIPPALLAYADERAFPIILVPWAVRFAEIMMGIIDRLIEQQYAVALDEPNRLLGSFAGALLGGSGLVAVAEALEGILQRPAVIVDSALQPLAHGALAADALSDVLAAWPERLASVDAETLNTLRAAFGGETARRTAGVEQLGLGPGLVLAAVARRRPVAYLYVANGDDVPIVPTLEGRAMEHAAIAVAMEMLRLRAAAEAESRVRGDFLWGLAAGVAGDRRSVATTAVLLGYDLRCPYEVAVGLAQGRDEDSRRRGAERLQSTFQTRRRRDVVVTRRDGEVLLLLPAGVDGSIRSLIANHHERSPDEERATWGIADGLVTLLDLHEGYRSATRALRVGLVIRGPGEIVERRTLGAYVMLDALARTDEAVASSRSVLRPILEYDRTSSRDLLSTLEVFLEANGNTSSAARTLHLNRHSLMYRLQKIETLTGLSLETYEDRFLLGLSIKLLRLVERQEGTWAGEAGSP
jgi:PucR family transcriptional regulator, purine catabolism regulatory protein